MGGITETELLSGTWHIGLTSLGMWRKRVAPSLNYLPLPDGSVADVVAWRDGGAGRGDSGGAAGAATGAAAGKGKQRTIVGIDRRRGGGWQWRGVGLITRFTPSQWMFVAWAEDGSWAVSRFERTPFTPAGTDLVFRAEHPGPEALAAARAACAREPATAQFASRLFAPPR